MSEKKIYHLIGPMESPMILICQVLWAAIVN